MVPDLTEQSQTFNLILRPRGRPEVTTGLNRYFQ